MAVAGIASKRNLEALGKPSPDLVAQPQSLLSMASIEVEEVRFRPQHQAAASRPAGEVMVLVQFNRRRRRSSPFKAEPLKLQADNNILLQDWRRQQASVCLWLPPRPIASRC